MTHSQRWWCCLFTWCGLVIVEWVGGCWGLSWSPPHRPPHQTLSANSPYIRGHSSEGPFLMFTQLFRSKDKLPCDLPTPQLSHGAFILAWPGCHGCHSDHMLMSQTRMWGSLWNVWSFSGDSGHVYLLSLNLNTTGVHFTLSCSENMQHVANLTSQSVMYRSNLLFVLVWHYLWLTIYSL